MNQSDNEKMWRGLCYIALGLLMIGGCRSEASPETSLPPTQDTLQNGQSEAADDLARQALANTPDDLDTALGLVAALTDKGDQSEAAEILLQIAPKYPDAQRRLLLQATTLLLEHGKPDDASRVLRQWVIDHPGDLECRRNLAAALNMAGYRFDANEHLRYLACRTTLSPRELTALINPTLTWVSFSQKPDIQDKELVTRSGLLNVIAALRANGDTREALSAIENSLQLGSSDSCVLAMHGWLLTLNQRFDDAKRWASSSDAACERYPAYWLALGNLMLQDQSPAAPYCFVEALRREPGCIEAVAGLAQSFTDTSPRTTKRLREREKLINESQSIAQAIAASPSNGWRLAGEIGRVMNTMGRYSESLAWQESLIMARTPATTQLAKLRQHRTATLSKFPSGLNTREVLCGIDPTELQSVDQELATWRKGKYAARSPQSNTGEPKDLPDYLPATFVNIANSVGIIHRHQNAASPVEKHFRLYEALGSGVACLDYDNDGLIDLYLGQAACNPQSASAKESNALYRGLGRRFQETALDADAQDFNYTHGVTSGDWNQDGFADLLIANIGVNRLMINQGDGTFVEKKVTGDSESHTWNRPMLTMSVAMADLTGDSLPDIFETNYVDDPRVFLPIEYDQDGRPVVLPGPKHFGAAEDRLFATLPDGQIAYQPLGEPADIASTGMGLLITDFDLDRKNEVIVANDQNPNQFWKRGTNDQLTDQAALLGCAYGVGGSAYACMGIAAADVNQDGLLDVHMTNFAKEPSNLYLQNKFGVFQDRAVAMQLDQPTLSMVGFGTQTFDYDNNTTTDIVIANGHIEDFRERGTPFRMPTQLLALTTQGYRQIQVAGDNYWNEKHLGRSVARLDWNRDGKVDLAITDLTADFVLLENRTEQTGNFLQLELVGTKSERDAIGTRVTVQCSAGKFTQVVQTGDGYLGKNQPGLFFGIGSSPHIDTITIQWPSGIDETISDVVGNQHLKVIEGQRQAAIR
ncbi:MAG: FG-GAP-like repeat-containing protein [Pirellulaceae bacterium]